jgi:hypothetical protein
MAAGRQGALPAADDGGEAAAKRRARGRRPGRRNTARPRLPSLLPAATPAWPALTRFSSGWHYGFRAARDPRGRRAPPGKRPAAGEPQPRQGSRLDPQFARCQSSQPGTGPQAHRSGLPRSPPGRAPTRSDAALRVEYRLPQAPRCDRERRLPDHGWPASSARSETTTSAPRSASCAAWPVRSTPTTSPNPPARPASTPARESSNTAA